MLQNMRDSASSWTIKIILVFVALSFIIWGVGGKDKNKGGVVAVVEGEEIRYPEFKRTYDNMYDFLKRNNTNMDVNNDFWEKIVRRNALNGIILKKLLKNMANEVGIVVSDKELADRIQADTNFFNNGKFDRALYLRALRANRLKPADFEEDYRNSIKQEKLEKSVTSTLFASKQEVLDAYIYENEKIDINYIAISPTFFERKVEVKDDELTKYFEASKEKFRRDEKITAEILLAEPASFVTGITLDEQRVSDFYKLNQDKFTIPKKIRARHILFRESGLTTPESPVRTKAESVLQEIKAGKDFAELAKKHSDDFSAQSGGDLGFFSKGRMVKEFEDVAFSLKEGEVSQVVKTEFGYHIIKVEKIEEESVKPLAIARGEIEQKLKNDDSVNLAKAALEKILKEEDPKGAGLKGFPAKYPRLKTAEYILSKKDSLHQALSANAFSLKIGDVGGVIEEGNVFYILRPLSMKESFIPSLTEIRGEVELGFRAAEGEKIAEKELAQLVAKIKAGEDITASVSGDIFFEKGTSGFIGRRGFVPAFGRDSKDVIEKSFAAPKGEFLTFKGADKSYIFNIQSTLSIDIEAFKKDEESFTKQFIESKRNKFLTNWRDNLIKKATEDGRVKISEGFSV